MDELKKPILRFKGFTENWEQRQLSDYLETSNEKNLDNFYTKQDVLSVSGDVGIVNQIEFQGRSFAGASVANYGVVHTGDVVYTKSPLSSNPFGIIKTNKGKAGIVSTLYAVYHTRDNVYPNFVQNYFEQNARLNNYLHPLVNKGAKNDMKVSDENALKGQVIFPAYEEQKVISDYFYVLDKLISLHQRKYDKIVNVKKAMLEKMFPKDGRSVPEIRFDGFTGPWEQRKFEELVTPYSDPVATPTDGYFRLGIRSHAKGTFHSYVEPGKELETAQMHKVAADKFIVNITFGWEHAVAITTGDDVGRLVSHRFPQFSLNEGNVPNYFKYLILDEKFRHHLLLSSPGGAGRNRVLNLNQMLEYKFWVTSKEEQERIATFMEQLDSIINLQQHRLEKLRNIKSSCMEKMFV